MTKPLVFPRDPLLTAIISAICPGAGQVYNGQVIKGIVFLLTCWLIFPWIWSVVDSYRVAAKINLGELPNIGTSFHVFLFLLIPVLTFISTTFFFILIFIRLVS